MRFVTPPVSYAQPLGPTRTGLAYTDFDRTVDELGSDGPAWRRLLEPLVNDPEGLARLTMTQLGTALARPSTMLRLGTGAIEQGSAIRGFRFREDEAPAMLSGVFAHVADPSTIAAAAGGLALAATAHTTGWPIAIGGSQRIADTLADDLLAHGGTIHTGERVRSVSELDGHATLLNLAPRDVVDLAAHVLPAPYVARLERYRHGPAACKVDFALSAPVPWSDERLLQAGTVHIGGTRPELERAEREVAEGRHPNRPYVLLSQPSLFDPTRAPAGRHTVWAYCHVPNGSGQDMSENIVRQVERYAPGFRDTILGMSVRTGAELALHNANYVGGDFLGGAVDLRQLAFRPTPSLSPWSTPRRGLYLASASTSPGPAVHGMAGYHAARLMLRAEFGITTMPELKPST
jgi:phytoene dehydrogenase-like protein